MSADAAVPTEDPAATDVAEAAEVDAEPVYRDDHIEERNALWGSRLNQSYLARVTAKSNVPSGIICLGLAAGGAMQIGNGGGISMAIAGAAGLLLNALGFRNDRREARRLEAAAEAALTDEWVDPPAEELDMSVMSAPPFTYVDPRSGWRALDLMRNQRRGEDPEAPYYFPELRDALPLPSDAEREVLDRLADGTLTKQQALAKVSSEEAKFRVRADDQDSISTMYQTLAQALEIVVGAAPDEAFPATDPLNEDLENLLDMFASKLGLGASPGCVFDVQLPRGDGGTLVVRYDFQGDGEFGSTLIPLEELQRAAAMQRAEELGVPEAAPLSFKEADGAWQAVDGLCAAFPALADALPANAGPEGELRTGEAEETELAARVILEQCIGAIVSGSAPEILDNNLGALVSVIAPLAEPGSTLDLSVAAVIVRFTFTGESVETQIFSAETAAQQAADAPEPVAAETAAVAAPAPAAAAGIDGV